MLLSAHRAVARGAAQNRNRRSPVRGHLGGPKPMAPLCDGRYESPVHQLPLTRARRVAKVVAETFPRIDAPTSALEQSRTLVLAATGRDAQAGTLAAQLGQVGSPMRLPAAQRAQVRAASCVLVFNGRKRGRRPLAQHTSTSQTGPPCGPPATADLGVPHPPWHERHLAISLS